MLPSSDIRPGRTFRWGVLIFAILLLFTSPVFARTYHITKYHETVVVQEDGSAVVSEDLTFEFHGAYQGIYRRIPVEYPGPSGSNYTLFIESIDVTDDSGTALKFEKQYKGDLLQLKVYVPGASDATRTVRIRYVVLNGIRDLQNNECR